MKYIKEPESAEYGACTFEMDGQSVKFRVAKITPKKVGQFVTLWKRAGKIIPCDVADPFDLYIVHVRSGENVGQFVFPKAALEKQGILSTGGVGGKLAMRIYPPWDVAVNKQAKSTQKWQLEYFTREGVDQFIEIADSLGLSAHL